MKKIKQLFSDSLHEFTVTKNLVLCGLMAAIAIVLSMVASISIGPYVKIGFSGIPNRIVEFLFGPVVGCIFGGALDLLKFMIKPDGSFFFGFTFNVMLAGLIYGCLLYHKPLSIKRIVIAEFLVKLIVNCGLNTLWISMLYGKAFFVLLPMRLLKNVIMLPIDSAVVFFALSLTKQTVGKLGFSLISPKKLSAEES